jgi:hypothetical protein
MDLDHPVVVFDTYQIDLCALNWYAATEPVAEVIDQLLDRNCDRPPADPDVGLGPPIGAGRTSTNLCEAKATADNDPTNPQEGARLMRTWTISRPAGPVKPRSKYGNHLPATTYDGHESVPGIVGEQIPTVAFEIEEDR